MPSSGSVPQPAAPARAERAGLVDTLRSAGCVFAEEEAGLLLAAATRPAELAGMVASRAAGTPLEHLLGWVAFRDRRIAVDPGVFVPRRRTEFLVEQAIAQFSPAIAGSGAHHPPVVVDLCCGCGAVGIAIADALGAAQLHAVDIDAHAVSNAARNLATAGCAGHAHLGDLYEPLPATLRGRIDILVANAPYVPTNEIALMPPEARLYEPPVALDGGPDGLAVLRRVVAGASDWLAPAGRLLLETSARQAPDLLATAATHGLAAEAAHATDLDATVVIASRPTDGQDTRVTLPA